MTKIFGIPLLFDLAHLHSALVHFPIALLLISLFFYVCARAKNSKGAELIGLGNLMAGTLLSYAAIGSGLLAEDVVTFQPAYRFLFPIHENLAYGIAGLFTLLSLWGFLAYRRPGNKVIPLFLFLFFLGAAAVGFQGYVGGILGHEGMQQKSGSHP